MNKGSITRIFRSLGIIHYTDMLKYAYQKMKFRSSNLQFKKEHPSIPLPPDYMMFEAYKLDYTNYYYDGRLFASEIIEDISKYIDLKDKNILDWGCGPARVIRHLPDLVDSSCKIFGTDYNPKTVAWCKTHIPDIDFVQNDVNPPLNYNDTQFDAIIGISIFTHLSAENHQHWYDELMRVARKDAIIMLTTHGIAFKENMTPKEIQQFDKGELVIRGNAIQGHRVFAAYHPPSYMKKLFNTQSEVLEHIEGKKEHWGIRQDTWILKKK